MSIYNAICSRGCQPDFDVRVCCELDCPKKNTNKQFKYCAVKLFTITWTIQNEIPDLYNVETGFNAQKWKDIKNKPLLEILIKKWYC